MTWLGYRHQVLGGGPAGIPPVDAMCPLGGLEALFGYFNDGTWLRRVAPSALVLFGATALMSLLLGRVFCGWICPLGTLTDFTSRLARKLGFKPRAVPVGIERPLRLLKYVLLIVIIALTWATGELVFRPYDPWMAWMHLSAGFSGAEVASLILLACLLTEFFVSRAWCTYLCPLGAVFAVFQSIAPVKIRRNADTCISCGKCNRACPTRLTPATLETVTSPDCLACGACVEACPKAGALHFALPGQRRVLPVLLVGLLGMGIFGSVYLGSKASGFWATSASAPKAANPATAVFGWMSLEQIAKTVNLPVPEVIRIMGLPADASLATPLKQLGNDDSARERLINHFKPKK